MDPQPSSIQPPPSPPATSGHGIGFGEAARTWARIGLLSFGGPAGQIAVMHRILVEEKRWIGERRFLHALNYCMLLPGPEAQQLACYIGWLLHRTRGGIVAGALFVLPGFVAILALSLLYALWRDTPLVQALLFGLKPAVIAIVLAAVHRLGSKILANGVMRAIAVAAFVSIFVFNAPFPAIVLAAGVIGWIGGRLRPDLFAIIRGHAASDRGSELPPVLSDEATVGLQPTIARSLATAAFWLALWWIPVAILTWAYGREHVFVQEGLFFSKAAVITFGGAYSVLTYLAQQAVDTYHWLSPSEMMDGLGMAETTPGPLIMVVQFVGFMGALHAGGDHPLITAILASVLVTWVTFMPSYLYIFLGAPWIERLRGNLTLSSALSGITAAVVGVILNLALWFAIHAVFHEQRIVSGWGVRLQVPVWSTVDWLTLGLAIAASIAMLRFKLGMMWTLTGCVAIGMAWKLGEHVLA